jgi:hypothetical protein
VDDPTQGRSEASSSADSTVVKARWLRVVRVIVGVVIVGAEVIVIGVEKLAIGGVVIFNGLLLFGIGLVSGGLELTPAEQHDLKPQFGDEGYLWLWTAYRLPLRLARVWWLAWGWRPWPQPGMACGSTGLDAISYSG